MGGGPRRPLRRRRVLVGDARNNGSYLRTTWHVEGRVFVVSTWDEEVCTAAVRVPVEDAAGLVGLLVDGLAEAAAMPAEAGTTDSPGDARGSRHRGLLTLRRDLEGWVQHARARLGALISGQGGPGRPAGPSDRREPSSSPGPVTPPPTPPPTPSPPDEIRWTA
jgi:hypothetical protein